MKVKDLPPTTTLADDDLIYAVDDSAGINGGKKIKKSDLANTLGGLITPANHGANHSEGGLDAIPNATPSVGGLESAVDKTKLNGVETGATADQTDSEIKTAYENNLDTNAFTDSEKTDLAANTGHRGSDGKDHSDVVLNTTHRSVVSGNPHSVDITEAVAASGVTNITESELENLSNGSNADALHLHSPSAFAEFVTVAKSGGDYTTIASALLDSKVTAATVNTPAVIYLYPGVYGEAPFILPTHVDLIGLGNNCVLRPSAPLSSAFITLSSFSEIQDVCLDANAQGAGGDIGVAVTTVSGTDIHFMDSQIIGFETAISCTGVTATMQLRGLFISNVTNGIILNNGGLIRTMDMRMDANTDAITLGNSGTNKIVLIGTNISNSVTTDLKSLNSNNIIEFTGSYNGLKRNFVVGTTFLANSVNGSIIRNSGKFIFENKGDVGVPGGFSGLDIGEGGSYLTDQFGTEIVEYWSYADVATSGNKFNRFGDNAGTQLSGANDAIIVGSRHPFSALRLNITATMLGTIQAQYWNGAAWINTSLAGYEKTNRTHRTLAGIFTTVETQYVEHSLDTYTTWAAANNVLDQVPNSDLGESLYWIRYQNVGALTTAMIFNLGKARGDDFDITGAQINENWGRTRRLDTVSIDSLTFIKDPILSKPATIAFNPSASINFEGKASLFEDLVLEATNIVTIIPTWADTSTPLKLQFQVSGDVASTAPVEFEVRTARFTTGDNLNGGALPEILAAKIINLSGTAFVTQFETVEINLENWSPGDNLVIQLSRDAQVANVDDTYPGGFILVEARLNYTRKTVN